MRLRSSLKIAGSLLGAGSMMAILTAGPIQEGY
jgi:hypothetical protein